MEKEEIKLTAIFDREIFEKHYNPLVRDISRCDFPDLLTRS